MEAEFISSSEVSSTDISSNTEAHQNLQNLHETLSQDENIKNEKSDSALVLHLQSTTSINDPNSENDESLEKLSAVIEQSEDTLVNTRSPVSQDYKYVLQERVESLQEVMTNLKEKLKNELMLWKQEKEEFQQLRERNDILALEEATAAARAAAAAYVAESPMSKDLDDVFNLTTEESLRELSILEYQKKLAQYQDEYSFNQAEKRYNSYWQLVAQVYKQKLSDAERVCNEELEKLRHMGSSLKPLKEITSQWSFEANNDHGDSMQQLNSGLRISNIMTCNNNVTNISSNFRKTDIEINTVSEIYNARFKREDLVKQHKTYEEL